MDATIEKIKQKDGCSFSVITYENAYFSAPLHIHPEYELILIEEGHGLSFIGDSVHKLSNGDFMLIGSNIPHLWLSSDEYYSNPSLSSKSIYTQFNKDIFPDNMYRIPELTSIYSILKESENGIYFSGGTIEELKDHFRNMVNLNGFEKLSSLYLLLQRLYTECTCKKLTSKTYINKYKENTDPIILKVNEFINKNYQNDISLEDIAKYIGMNACALCRYYKKHSNKRIFEYVTELRISYAVKLLLNKSINISQIAYDCGYNSLSHFNHQFKQITGYTPSEYSKFVLKI